MCRKPKSTSTKTSRINVNSIDEKTTENSVDANLNINYNPECESDYISLDDNMMAGIASKILKVEPKNKTLQIGNKGVGLLIESGSACSILNESLATEVINNSSLLRWLTTAPSKELKTFANEPIPVIGLMQTPVESNGRRIEDAELVVVRDSRKPLNGRHLFDALGISVTQTPNSFEGSMININTQCPFKKRIANPFPQLFTRIGRS